MKAIVKSVLWLLAGIVLILAAAAAYIAATFDPNEYKPQIVRAVKDRTERNLRLDGDIKLAFFPRIAATLGRVSLSERGSEREFAAVDDFRVALKLLPLLSKQVVVETVEIKNLRAHLVRFKDGTTNIDDLTKEKGPGSNYEKSSLAPFPYVTIENAALTYTDEAAGAVYALSKLNLRTGRIASGVPVKIDLAFMVKSDQPVMNLETALKATAAFDLDQQRCTLAGIDFGVTGLAAGISNLVATAKGDVDARLPSREFLISRLAIALTGKLESGNLDVKFDAPRLTVTGDNVSGETLVLDATLRTAKGKLVAKFEIPGIDGNAKAFKAGALTASIDAQQDGASIKARLTGPLAGSIEQQKLELPKLVATVNVTHPTLLKNPLDAAFNASAHADLARQTGSLAFAAKIDDSAIKGSVALTKFTPPFYAFDVDIDRLDADRYLPQRDSKEPPDLAALKSLNASGSVKIGALTLSNVKATNVRIEIKAADGVRARRPVSPSP
ncbi:MAG: AsmA family protein [Betaproteobacteria bacterium]|nr:AsmA family protein [Betaproteobacteria bacterium]